MNCLVCNSQSESLFTAQVLNKYDVQYFHCNVCSFVFTEQPYWLEEAYTSAINLSDTGIAERNLDFTRTISTLLFFLFDKKKSFVDYAGGYGIFTRLMRDVGFDFYWIDPHCENLLARGFEYQPDKIRNVELVSAFEVFEHLQNPLTEVEKMLKISKNIIFSTQPIPNPVPKPDDWWYYGLDHGQHISFYSTKTLSFIANHFGLNFYTYKYLHLFTTKRISLILFRLLIILSRSGLFFIIKKMMRSKTWNDHLLMMKK